MIKNERQYRITKAAADKFGQALARMSEHSESDLQLHPLLRKAQEDAMRSQLADLRAELEEYDALRFGQRAVLEVESFEELPRALIRARIASGMSQKGLADRLGLKEQQLQRYEATEYASASFTRVSEVIRALGIRVREDVLLPNAGISMSTIFGHMKQLGFDRDFVLKRLISPQLAANLEDHESTELVFRAADGIGRVFGWPAAALLGPSAPRLDPAAVGTARFKVAPRVNERRMSAYTVYAHYLALLVLQATPDLPKRRIPVHADEVRETILRRYGSVTFENLLRYAWDDLGVPVLPLKDSGAFHGACWRIAGRNVIALKQRTSSSARWAFDLAHELFHCAQEPEHDAREVLEVGETDQGRRDSTEEQLASRFAGDVLLDGRAEELAQISVQVASGKLQRLKDIVPQVAARQHVPTGALANYMAFRLSLQGENWWGAATNLQATDGDPWEKPRDLLLERLQFERLNELDQHLLMQALVDGNG